MGIRLCWKFRSNPLGTQGYVKRCENSRGAKRETGESDRYHGSEFDVGVKIVLDDYQETKCSVVE